MGLLTPKSKKDGKKNTPNNPKNANQGSKFITNKNVKGSGFVKKGMTGGSQRGS